MPTLLRAQARPIKVGLVNPMSGFVAYSGAQCRLGELAAIEEINAGGGIKSMGGAKLEAVLGDTQSRPEVGVSVVEKMNEDGVAAYIGCFQSPVALPATRAAAKYNTPFVIDVGASDLIVNRGLKNVFRLKPGFGKCVEDAIVALGDINKAAHGIAKSAVLVHEESEFGTGTAKLLASKLPNPNLRRRAPVFTCEGNRSTKGNLPGGALPAQPRRACVTRTEHEAVDGVRRYSRRQQRIGRHGSV